MGVFVSLPYSMVSHPGWWFCNSLCLNRLEILISVMMMILCYIIFLKDIMCKKYISFISAFECIGIISVSLHISSLPNMSCDSSIASSKAIPEDYWLEIGLYLSLRHDVMVLLCPLSIFELHYSSCLRHVTFYFMPKLPCHCLLHGVTFCIINSTEVKLSTTAAFKPLMLKLYNQFKMLNVSLCL